MNEGGPAGQTPFRRTRLTWTLYLLLGLFTFSMGLIGPVVPYLRQEFHLDYTLAALHMSLFAVGMVAGGLSAAPLMERLGVMAGLWGGLCGTMAGLLLLVLAPSAWLTLAAMLGMSLFATLLLAAIQTALASLYPASRGRALMEANVMASLACSGAPFLIALGAGTPLGWRIIAPAFALAAASVAGFGGAATRKHGASATGQAPDAPGPLPRAYWLWWGFNLVSIAVEWCLGFWAAEYLKGLPGHSLSVAAAGAGVFQVGAVAARLLSSWIATRVGELRILAGAILVTAVGFPLFWSCAGIPSAFLGIALCGMGASIFYPLTLSQAVAASGGRVRQASSYLPIASGLSLGLAPLALGRLADQTSLRTALLAIPVALAVMAGLLAARRRAS